MIGQRFAANVGVSVKKKIKNGGLKDVEFQSEHARGRAHTHMQRYREREMENAIVQMNMERSTITDMPFPDLSPPCIANIKTSEFIDLLNPISISNIANLNPIINIWTTRRSRLLSPASGILSPDEVGYSNTTAISPKTKDI